VAGAVKRGMGMTATGALVSLGPSEVKEVALTRLFRGKLSLKLNQTHGILLHCNSSFFSIFTLYYSIFAELKL
jgi:hypothetical protein